MRMEFLDPAKKERIEAIASIDTRIPGEAGYPHSKPLDKGTAVGEDDYAETRAQRLLTEGTML
jgi:hypothetical protein